MGDRWFDLGNFAVNNELERRARGAPAHHLLRRAAGRAPPRHAQAVPLHVGPARGDVGRRPERDLGARLRLHGLRDEALRAARGDRLRSALRRLAAGRPALSPRGELPGAARCVVIGGGVGGASIAYHLTKLGWDDVVLVERNQLTSGSTFHSAGLVGQLRGSVSLTRMMMYSVELYRELGEDCGWVECGEHPAGLERGAHGGAAPPGGLGEDVRPAARADLGGRGARALPADVDGRRAAAPPGCRATATSTRRSSPSRSPSAPARAARASTRARA